MGCILNLKRKQAYLLLMDIFLLKYNSYKSHVLFIQINTSLLIDIKPVPTTALLCELVPSIVLGLILFPTLISSFKYITFSSIGSIIILTRLRTSFKHITFSWIRSIIILTRVRTSLRHITFPHLRAGIPPVMLWVRRCLGYVSTWYPRTRSTPTGRGGFVGGGRRWVVPGTFDWPSIHVGGLRASGIEPCC